MNTPLHRLSRLREALARPQVRWLLAGFFVLFVMAVGWDAVARPGGGHTYSGSSSSSGGSSSSSSSGGSSYSGSSSSGGSSSSSSSGGGGGSSSDDGFIGFLVELLFEVIIRLLAYLFVTYPEVMFPLTGILIVLGLLYYYTSKWLGEGGWSSRSQKFWNQVDAWRWMRAWDRDGPLELSHPEERVDPSRGTPARLYLKEKLADDPDFSVLLLADFVQGLYSAAHLARGKKQLAMLGGYLRPAVIEALERLGGPKLAGVEGVVVGSMTQLVTPKSKAGDPENVWVVYRLHANYTELLEGGEKQSYLAVEEWSLRRAVGVKTRAREDATALACPNCGAALDRAYQGACGYCGKNTADGSFDWVVSSVHVNSRELRTNLLDETTEEEGTTENTKVHVNAEGTWATLVTEDPALTDEAFVARVGVVFTELQTAWTTKQWARARAFLTDSVYESMRYWLEMYEAQQRRNVIEEPKLRRVELARVLRDGPIDAVTVRVFASCLDYTVQEPTGERVLGSKTARRRYTEYWTFLRAKGKRGAPRTELKCPQCGAELAVTMAGECTYCHTRVVTGAHDWVLSRIEQDEQYEG